MADPLGNFALVTTDTVTVNRTHDNQNRLTEMSTGGVTTTFAYDENCNLWNDQNGTAFRFDAWNRLSTVDGSTYYRYDALGRRNYIVYLRNGYRRRRSHSAQGLPAVA